MSKINLMDNTTTHHLKYRFLAIFTPFTPFLQINGINTPLRHDPTNLTLFWANMGKIRQPNPPYLRFDRIFEIFETLGFYRILPVISCYIFPVIFWVIFLTLQNYFYDVKTNIYKKSIDFYKWVL